MRKEEEKKKEEINMEEIIRAGQEQLIAMQAQLQALQKEEVEEDSWKKDIVKEEIEESDNRLQKGKYKEKKKEKVRKQRMIYGKGQRVWERKKIQKKG